MARNSRITSIAMKHCLGPLGLALLLLSATPGALAQASQTDLAKAAERCEAEVAETIRRIRGKAAQEVQFVAGRRVLTPATDDETSVRGEGRYRSGSGDAVPFTYSCAYNAKNDSTAGALFRDVPAQRAAVERAFEPDLTNISPEACESAAANSLKAKHPRVGRIVFGSDSRRIQPGSNGQVQLLGQGAVQRAAGMSATPFTYRCEVNPRSGRVVEIQTSD
jgi:hypothetical protein